ncbi:BlaI/MecI/CopY family transcriptional regulator [Candidatus Woesearchaeota archaeon]|nr:BlaI/MecI/CopY family transcriptional regulator [Candidatus Woesearchaeota archaeon]
MKQCTFKKFESILSPLEADVLRMLWPDKKMKVKEIHTKLKTKRKVALSSVAVILDRLHTKKIVDRQMETARGGVKYTYHPLHNKSSFERHIVEDVVNKLVHRFGNNAIAYFQERFTKK